MNRRLVHPLEDRGPCLPQLVLAMGFLLLSLQPSLAHAQSVPGRTEAVTPAAESQHEQTEEATEPVAENPTLRPEQEALAQRIFGELISPCCWTTTVAQHGSGAAPRIQAEVRRMIASGMGRRAILDRYVQEYGERILASPDKKGFNLAAYWVPYLGIGVGALFIAMAYRRRGRGRHPQPATAVATGSPSRAGAPAAPPQKPVPGSEEDYRRRVEEEIRRSS
jgi:cytochrome c-type biogenesis protein CcmH/NrfF